MDFSDFMEDCYDSGLECFLAVCEISMGRKIPVIFLAEDQEQAEDFCNDILHGELVGTMQLSGEFEVNELVTYHIKQDKVF